MNKSNVREGSLARFYLEKLFPCPGIFQAIDNGYQSLLVFCMKPRWLVIQENIIIEKTDPAHYFHYTRNACVKKQCPGRPGTKSGDKGLTP
jgi:hypothetical protein